MPGERLALAGRWRDFETACGPGVDLPRPKQRHPIYWPQPSRRDGRVAEGGGLLNRYRVEKLYRGFESPSLRQLPYKSIKFSNILKNLQLSGVGHPTTTER